MAGSHPDTGSRSRVRFCDTEGCTHDFQSRAQFRICIGGCSRISGHSGDATESEGLTERRSTTASRDLRRLSSLFVGPVDPKRLCYFLLGSSSGLTYLTPHGPTPCTWITVSSLASTKWLVPTGITMKLPARMGINFPASNVSPIPK